MKLSETLDFLRRALAADDSLYTIFAISEPHSGLPEALARSDYSDFLSASSDGGRFGVVDLWSNSELAGNQFRVEDPKKYVEIGQVLYEPLLLDGSGYVWWLQEGVMRGLGTFKEFLQNYVFGHGYLELSATKSDRWWRFLSESGILDENRQ